MANKLFTRTDNLFDFLEYIESIEEQCQEAKDYYYAEFTTETTLGEAIDHVTADPNFDDNWAAYCYMAFPDMVDETAFDGFENMATVKPTAHDYIDEVPKHRLKEKAIRPKDDKIKIEKKIK